MTKISNSSSLTLPQDSTCKVVEKKFSHQTHKGSVAKSQKGH